MFKFVGRHEGRPLLALGLTPADCEQLLAGGEFFFGAQEVSGTLPDLVVWVVAGMGDREIAERLGMWEK